MEKNAMKIQNNKTQLSVIIPVYNVENYLVECVNSVLAQSLKALEIILVDDGSTDNSGSLCDQLAAKDRRIVVIHKKNGGLSSARNVGLDIAKGQYVTFVDSDDVIIGNDTLSHVVQCLIEDNDLDIVQYDVLYDYTSSNEHRRNYPCRIYTGSEDIIKGYLAQNIHVSCCDKVFRADIFKDIRFPLNQISEDIAVIPEIVSNTRKLKTTKIGYYGYRYREGSISHSFLPYWKICSILNSYHKYLSYSYRYSAIRTDVIKIYTNLIWGYLSIVRKNYPAQLPQFYNEKIFLKIPLKDWIKNTKTFSASEKLKSFFVCVTKIRMAVLFQNLFTK